MINIVFNINIYKMILKKENKKKLSKAAEENF